MLYFSQELVSAKCHKQRPGADVVVARLAALILGRGVSSVSRTCSLRFCPWGVAGKGVVRILLLVSALLSRAAIRKKIFLSLSLNSSMPKLSTPEGS